MLRLLSPPLLEVPCRETPWSPRRAKTGLAARINGPGVDVGRRSALQSHRCWGA